MAVKVDSIMLLRRSELKTLTGLLLVIALLINIFKSWALLLQMSVDSVKNRRIPQSTFSVIVKLLHKSGSNTLKKPFI